MLNCGEGQSIDSQDSDRSSSSSSPIDENSVDEVPCWIGSPCPVGKKGKFVCIGKNAETVRRVLRRWGWYEMPEQSAKTSLGKNCDLLWASVSKTTGILGDVPPNQLVNHFPGSSFLENKALLGSFLARCPTCAERFFPRQYDLSHLPNLRAFIEDYVVSQAQIILQEDPDHEVSKRVINRSLAGKDPLPRCCHEWIALIPPGTGEPMLPIPPLAEAKFQACIDRVQECAVEGKCEACQSSVSKPVPAAAQSPKQPEIDGLANAWVVKNPSINKAKGIRVVCGLRSILERCERSWSCVVQKYIERPLRLETPRGLAKVDLRMWVLVLSWNPLTAFAYSESYFRVATRCFELDSRTQPEKFAHVTNSRDEDNRITAAQLFERLGPGSEEAFETMTWPLMLDAVRAGCFAVQGSVVSTAQLKGVQGTSNFELFGFDFALDEEMRPWLLEVNSSPDMLHDCEIPEIRTWAETATEGLLSIVVGHHNGTFKIPTVTELEQCPPPRGAKPSRLFSASDVEGHDPFKCFGQQGARVQECLAAGLDLGAACGKWRLILRDQLQDPTKIRLGAMRLHCSNRCSGDIGGHNRILRDCFLPSIFKKEDEVRIPPIIPLGRKREVYHDPDRLGTPQASPRTGSDSQGSPYRITTMQTVINADKRQTLVTADDEATSRTMQPPHALYGRTISAYSASNHSSSNPVARLPRSPIYAKGRILVESPEDTLEESQQVETTSANHIVAGTSLIRGARSVLTSKVRTGISEWTSTRIEVWDASSRRKPSHSSSSQNGDLDGKEPPQRYHEFDFDLEFASNGPLRHVVPTSCKLQTWQKSSMIAWRSPEQKSSWITGPAKTPLSKANPSLRVLLGSKSEDSPNAAKVEMAGDRWQYQTGAGRSNNQVTSNNPSQGRRRRADQVRGVLAAFCRRSHGGQSVKGILVERDTTWCPALPSSPQNEAKSEAQIAST